MKKNWELINDSEVNSLADLDAALIKNKGLSADFFDIQYNSFSDLEKLSDYTIALTRIREAINKKQKVVIYGDYDIDGITATSLLKNSLLWFGLTVDYYIPDRFEEGYGLNIEALEKLSEDYDLIITVDCGITSVEEAAAIKGKIDLIITDHHTIGEVLPDCLAKINPLREDSTYDFRYPAGVGVAFYLLIGLIYDDFKTQKLSTLATENNIKAGQEKWMLDLVAIGTISDIVPLYGDNRIMVHFGLIVMAMTKNLGLQMMQERLNLEKPISTDIGFKVGPILNAAGRIEHAKLAVELFVSTDKDSINSSLDKLMELNSKRKLYTQEMSEHANLLALEYDTDQFLAISDPTWSRGIMGIVAARVAGRNKKPTLIIEQGFEVSTGSGRSFGDFDLYAMLHNFKELFIKFGGHKYAVGFSIKTENIPILREKINNHIRETNLEINSNLHIDCKLSPSLLTVDTVESLNKFQPFGQDNSTPIFISNLTLRDFKYLGSGTEHLKMIVDSGNSEIEVLDFFSSTNTDELEIDSDYTFCYELNINEFRGNKTLQLLLKDYVKA